MTQTNKVLFYMSYAQMILSVFFKKKTVTLLTSASLYFEKIVKSITFLINGLKKVYQVDTRSTVEEVLTSLIKENHFGVLGPHLTLSTSHKDENGKVYYHYYNTKESLLSQMSNPYVVIELRLISSPTSFGLLKCTPLEFKLVYEFV